MNNAPDDFESLRKLLKLKRHEQPPPGYFSRFSGIVINRIEAEGRLAPQNDRWAQAPWLGKLFGLFERSPVTAGMFGAGLCAVLIYGIAAANEGEKSSQTAYTPAATEGGTEANAHASLALYNGDSHSEVFGRSTDPMFGSNLSNSPFGDAKSLAVSFSPAPQ
jgi:hypothetical protein